MLTLMPQHMCKVNRQSSKTFDILLLWLLPLYLAIALAFFQAFSFSKIGQILSEIRMPCSCPWKGIRIFLSNIHSEILLCANVMNIHFRVLGV